MRNTLINKYKVCFNVFLNACFCSRHTLENEYFIAYITVFLYISKNVCPVSASPNAV